MGGGLCHDTLGEVRGHSLWAKGQLVGVVLFFHHVGSGDGTKAVTLGGKRLKLTESSLHSHPLPHCFETAGQQATHPHLHFSKNSCVSSVMVIHTFNSSTEETEAGKSLPVQGQPLVYKVLHRETLS